MSLFKITTAPAATDYDFQMLESTNTALRTESFDELDTGSATTITTATINPVSFISDWLKEDDPIFGFEMNETAVSSVSSAPSGPSFSGYEGVKMETESMQLDDQIQVQQKDGDYWNCLFDDIEQPEMASILTQETEPQLPLETGTSAVPVTSTVSTSTQSGKGFLPTPIVEEEKVESAKKTKSLKKTSKVTKPRSSSASSASSSSSSSSSPKLDQLGIVSYTTKKRSAPLNDIKIDEIEDPVMMKRAKNTEAARRSRARKFQRMQQLEDKVEELLTINAQLVQEIERLKQQQQSSL